MAKANTTRSKARKPVKPAHAAPIVDEDDEAAQETALIYDAEDAQRRMQEYAQATGLDLETYTDDATAHVSLIEDGREVNVWRGDPLQYDLASIAREFGSGEYRLKIYMRDPATGMRPKRIDERIYYRLTVADEKTRRKMIATLDAPDTPAPQAMDTVAIMREMMTGFQASIASMITQMRPVEKDPMQTLQGIKELASIFVGNQPKPVSAMESVREFAAVADALKSLNPAPPIVTPDGDLNSGAVLMKGIDLLNNAIQANRDQKIGGATALPAPVAATPDANSFTDEQREEIEQMNFIIKMQLRSGVSLAKVNAEHAEYATGVYELLPDDAVVALASLPPGEFMEKLAQFDERVKLYSDWFLKVRAAIVALAVEDELLTTPEKAGNLPENATKPAIPGANTGGNS